MNDLEANAWGIPFLSPRDFYTVNKGASDPCGNAAVIAAGTWLGEAGLFRDGPEPRWLAAEMKGPSPAAAISRAGLGGRSALCARALDLFVSLYGAEAGNLALKLMATGGVYIGGGIAPKIASKFKGGRFMKAFTDKGRMGPLLCAVPVRLILNDDAALLGAARRAAFPPER